LEPHQIEPRDSPAQPDRTHYYQLDPKVWHKRHPSYKEALIDAKGEQYQAARLRSRQNAVDGL
jgi:hypothetical protein